MAPICVPGFAELLEGFGEEELRRHGSAVYGLWPELTLGYLNPAWFRFARENGGVNIPRDWGLGASVLDATTGPVRDLYADRLSRCLERGQHRRHDYECSTAEDYRRFHMDVYPLGAQRGLLVINTLYVVHPYDDGRGARPPIEELYLSADGTIVQCSYCRRVRRADDPGQWDWIPEWLKAPPLHTTGGLCKPCFRVHFPAAPLIT